MKFPNKIFELKETVIYDCLKIMEIIKEDTSIPELYKTCIDKCNGLQEFLDALDVLYAMGKIEYDYEGKRILNVK